MSYSTFSKRVRRFFRKRRVQEQLAQVSDPRQARGRRWPWRQVLETVVGGLLLQIRSCHQVDERTRLGPPLWVGELRLAPIPDATLQWILPQVDRQEVRQLLVESVRAEVRRKSVVSPMGAVRTLAIDGKCLWSGRRGGCPDCQVQGGVRVHRVVRALLTSARPRLFLDQRPVAAAENEMGAFAAFWAQVLDTYGRLPLFDVVTLDAGYGSLGNATRIDTAGYGYVVGLKANQPELWREAQRLLQPLAASQRPEARVLDRDHGRWVRRSLWRTAACAGWLDWSHLRQVWLVRTETFVRQTTPRADSVPVAAEDHYYITNLGWQRLEGVGILGVVRSHWGIENNGFRTLDMDWQEEHAWCTKGMATDVLGLLRLWAYNLLGLLKGRYLRAGCYRRLTLVGFVAWLERVSAWGAARRRRSGMVPVG
jgi:Transposase DDE domain